MKIYLLIENWDGCDSILQCFTTLEKAEDFFKELKRPRNNFSIMETEVK